MGERLDLSRWYGGHYYRTYAGAPYERSELWLTAMRTIADGIIRELDHPRKVLDAGCACGLLVEALRAKGVEAFGLDFSPYAIEQVAEHVRPYCWVGSVLDPLPDRYDLIVCNEVLEHLPPGDADTAIARLCGAADDILFASSPAHFEDPTHLNVQPVEYWAAAFAKHGFLRDLDFDGAGFLPRWAGRFRKRAEPLARVVSGYERRVWALSTENAAMRAHALEQVDKLAAAAQALRERPEVAPLERTIEEQKEHIDALAERINYMTDREGDLRRLVLDAHEQLLQRDRMLQEQASGAVVDSLRVLVDQRTAWAQEAVREMEAGRALVSELQDTVEARTDWARQLETLLAAATARVTELEEIVTARTAWSRELEELVNARTAWAQQAAANVERAHAVVEQLRGELADRTTWAQSASADLEHARATIAELRGDVDARTAWALTAAGETEQARAEIANLRTELEERTRAVAAITGSRVWRAAAPLRRARRWMTKPRTEA